MKIINKLIDKWPKLTWAAQCPKGAGEIVVYHGPYVETGPDWCVEAVWAGVFSEGDFDRTDLVFGSGLRLRGEKIVFVPAGTTNDRLWHCEIKNKFYISNSLAALLATADLSLVTDYRYDSDIKTICKGLSSYVRRLPTTTADINLQYFHNLEFDGWTLSEVSKPDSAPKFDGFSDYRRFLSETAKSLAANMSASGRTHTVQSLTSISSGYDACATAVVAQWAGCTQAVTIERANSLWRGSDSGAPIAKHLGLECHQYRLSAGSYPNEESIWAATGRPGSLNWTQFDFQEPLCIFFTGCRGDQLWALEKTPSNDPFFTPSVGDLGICEYRLLRGMFHCVVPVWGLRHVDEIREISRLPEMAPWTLNSDYDRPIPRRIIEEAGVPRGSFASRKKNTSIETSFAWPFSHDAISSYHEFLRKKSRPTPPRWIVPLFRRIAAIDKLIYMNITARFNLWDIGLRWRLLSKKNSLFFHWGNDELKQHYAAGLSAAGLQAGENNN